MPRRWVASHLITTTLSTGCCSPKLPACHHQTAAVVVLKSLDGVLDRLCLQGPRFLHRALGGPFLHLDAEVLPEVDLPNLRMGVLDRKIRVPPLSTGRHDPTQAEDLLLRGAEELVDLALGEGAAFVVALALDGDPFA